MATPSKAFTDVFGGGTAQGEVAPSADFAAAFPPPAPEPEFDISDTLERGTRTLGANIADFFGADEIAEGILEGAPQAQFPNFRQLEGVGDVGGFVGERTLESLPSTGLGVGTGIVGGFVTGGPVGAIVGGLIGLGVPLIGESRREVREGGGEGTFVQGLPAGLANTALEAVPVAKVAKALGLNKVFKDSVADVVRENGEEVGGIVQELTKGGKTVGDIALTEGVTEAVQTLNNKLNERFFNDKEVLALNAKDREELLQAFVGGVAGGTGIGTTAVVGGKVLDKAGVTKPRETPQDKEAAEIQENINHILRELDKKENIIDEAASSFGDTSEAPGKVSQIVPKEKREGPGASIFGEHVRNAQDSRQAGMLSRMPVRVGVGEDGTPIYRDRKAAQTLNPEDQSRASISRFGTLVSKKGRIEGSDLEVELQGAAQAILDKLGMKGLNVTLMDKNAFNDHTVFSEVTDDTFGGFARGKLSGSMVYVNAGNIFAGAENVEAAKGKMLETLAHEMGHAVINHMWQEIGGGKGNPKKGRVYKALVGEYREWLRDIDNMDTQQFFDKYDSPFTRSIRSKRNTSMKQFAKERHDYAEYLMRFDEYAAQQMAQIVASKSKEFTGAKEFWAKVVEKLQEVYESISGIHRPAKTFEAWVDTLMLRTELKELIERQANLGKANKGTKESEGNIESEVQAEVGKVEAESPGLVEGRKKLRDEGLRLERKERPGSVEVVVKDSEGEVVGGVRADDQGDGVMKVFTSFLAEDFRGNGFGALLYNELIAEGVKDGFEVMQSDARVSAEAQRVWESLGKQGWVVENSRSPLEPTVEGQVTADGSPMFTMRLNVLPSITQPDASILGDLAGKLGLKEVEGQLNEHQGVSMGFLRAAKLLTPLQLAELVKKVGINTPTRYMELVRDFANTKMKQIEVADTIAQEWRALGKTKSTQLGNFLFAVSDLSDEQGRRLTPDELESLRKVHKVDDETFQMWRRIDRSFQDILENVERGLVLDAATSYIQDPRAARAFRDAYMALSDDGSRLDLIEQFTGIPAIPDLTDPGDVVANPLKAELDRIQGSLKEMREKNYFPRSRLGQYTITIKAGKIGDSWEGHDAGKAGETLGFYSYETKKERDAQLKEMRGEALKAGLSIVGSKMDTKVFAMMGMPDALIQKIINDESMDLTQEQLKQLKDVSLNLSPGKKFLKNLKKRRGIAGFNEDALRVYANYMMSAANHLARVEHSKSMLQVLQEMDTQIQTATREGQGEVLDDLVTMKDYFREHFDYLMKPDNDWASLRAVGFLWYLGFNVKSALVNLTQIPMVTYPVMAGRFGDDASLKAITKSYRQVTGWLRGKEGSLNAEELALIQKFREAGIIDESMVMELAGLGEGDVLKRSIPGWGLDNAISKVSYYGGMMFRLGEKYNRLVTAVAAYKAARDDGQTIDEATATAREMIEKSQFEYAKWNRPEFMRGKKSVIFLFWQYMQHATFLFAGGAGKQTAARMWLMALMIAGIEGLPFWNTLTAILDFGGTQAKKALGVANPRVALEEDIRELLLEITDKPDLMLRGMSSYWGLGPAHLASLLGAPIPNVDIQGSLGFGSPVPFLDEMFQGSGSSDEELGKFTAAVLGPVGGMALQAYRQVSSTDPNVWKRVEKSMPVFAKNAMQGSRWLAEGRETFRGEGTFLNMERPEDRVAAVMKALGFTPTRMTQKYLQVKATQESTVFWTLRRQLLLEDFAYARAIEDREAQADATKAIKRHNAEIKRNKALSGMGITSGDLRKSLKARRKSVRLRELGIPQSRRARPIAADVQRLFPVEGEGV